MNSQELLEKFALAKSKFFDLHDSEETQVRFLFAEIVANHFDGGKTSCIRYHFEIDGKELMWDRISRELATQMAKIPEGTLIKIKRIGQKSKTKYFITEVKE